MVAFGTLDLALMGVMGVWIRFPGFLRKLSIISMALQTGGHGGRLLRGIFLVTSFAGDSKILVPVTEEITLGGRGKRRF